MSLRTSSGGAHDVDVYRLYMMIYIGCMSAVYSFYTYLIKC